MAQPTIMDTPMTASHEAGFRGSFRDPKFGLDRGNSFAQKDQLWKDLSNKDETRVMGPAITTLAYGGSRVAKIRHNTINESTGLPRSLPTNVGDVRPIHVNVNSLRNTTASRYSADTLCGNWNEERRDPNAKLAYSVSALGEQQVAHIYASEAASSSFEVGNTRKPTDPITTDESDRLQSTHRLAFTDPFNTPCNVKTQGIVDVFPETDVLQDYRQKWTSRPFSKKTTHNNDFKNYFAECQK